MWATLLQILRMTPKTQQVHLSRPQKGGLGAGYNPWDLSLKSLSLRSLPEMILFWDLISLLVVLFWSIFFHLPLNFSPLRTGFSAFCNGPIRTFCAFHPLKKLLLFFFFFFSSLSPSHSLYSSFTLNNGDCTTTTLGAQLLREVLRASRVALWRGRGHWLWHEAPLLQPSCRDVPPGNLPPAPPRKESWVERRIFLSIVFFFFFYLR